MLPRPKININKLMDEFSLISKQVSFEGIFVDDCIFSGGCVIKNVDFMQSVGLKVMGVATATTRLSLKIKDVPVKSLYQVEFVKINENNCQLCLLNKPIVARNIRE